MVQIYKTPFAAQGDKDAIPVPVQGDGAVSVTQGFGYDYEREYEDPAAKDIRREIMNGILHDLSEAIGEMQQFGFATWQAVDGGWPEGANVNHGGGVWQSLANANTEEPGTGALWKPILFDNIVQATESVLGLVRLATTAQARALTNNEVVLTPQKLWDAFTGGNQGSAFQKLPGGKIIQRAAVGSSNTSGVTVNYPHACSSPPAIIPCITQSTEADPIIASLGNITNTSCRVGAWSLDGNRRQYAVNLIIFGDY